MELEAASGPGAVQTTVLHGAIIHDHPSPAPPMALAAVIPITRYLECEVPHPAA
jgi:hypothetical protein